MEEELIAEGLMSVRYVQAKDIFMFYLLLQQHMMKICNNVDFYL